MHPAIAHKGTSMNSTTDAHAAPGAVARADLKRDFPGWNFTRSAQGRWWAQCFPVPREQFNVPNLVDADSAAGLRDKLMESALVIGASGTPDLAVGMAAAHPDHQPGPSHAPDGAQ